MSAETWRVVNARGVTTTITAECVIPTGDHTSARWRFTYDEGKASADVDADDDTNPREALCVWAGYQVTEIRGPGELTTAEQIAAAEARVAALEAALRHYAPTCGDCDRLATHESHDGVAVSCDACRTTRWRRRPDWRELTHADVLRSLDTPEPGR